VRSLSKGFASLPVLHVVARQTSSSEGPSRSPFEGIAEMAHRDSHRSYRTRSVQILTRTNSEALTLTAPQLVSFS
jgi:hypothetical protein